MDLKNANLLLHFSECILLSHFLCFHTSSSFLAICLVPYGPLIRLSLLLFVYLLPVSASRGQSEDVCARQKKDDVISFSAGGQHQHRYNGAELFGMQAHFKTDCFNHTEPDTGGVNTKTLIHLTAERAKIF